MTLVALPGTSHEITPVLAEQPLVELIRGGQQGALWQHLEAILFVASQSAGEIVLN